MNNQELLRHYNLVLSSMQEDRIRQGICNYISLLHHKYGVSYLEYSMILRHFKSIPRPESAHPSSAWYWPPAKLEVRIEFVKTIIKNLEDNET